MFELDNLFTTRLNNFVCKSRVCIIVIMTIKVTQELMNSMNSQRIKELMQRINEFSMNQLNILM